MAPFMSSPCIHSPYIYVSNLTLLQNCLWHTCGTAQCTDGCAFFPLMGHKQQVSYMTVHAIVYCLCYICMYGVYHHLTTQQQSGTQLLPDSYCIFIGSLSIKNFSYYALLMLLQSWPLKFDTDVQLWSWSDHFGFGCCHFSLFSN